LHNQSGFVKLSSGQLARCPEFLLERKLRVSLRRKEAKFATKKKKKKKRKPRPHDLEALQVKVLGKVFVQ
jgi:hypothetical protein